MTLIRHEVHSAQDRGPFCILDIIYEIWQHLESCIYSWKLLLNFRTSDVLLMSKVRFSVKFEDFQDRPQMYSSLIGSDSNSASNVCTCEADLVHLRQS